MINCLKCNDKYKYTDKDTGIEIDCTCTIKKEYEEKANKKKDIDISNKKTEAKAYATINGIIPKERVEDEFNSEYLRERLKDTHKAKGYVFKRYNEYVETLNGIIGKLTLGEKLRKSYVVSSPNSYGKTTFVNTCQKICILNGWSVAPYSSLIEIAELQQLHLSFLKRERLDYNGLSEKYELYMDKIQDLYIQYGVCYKDFIEAEVAFLSLTSSSYSYIELPTLKYILSERSKRYKPTIVTLEFAIEDYYNQNEVVNKGNQLKKTVIHPENRRFWEDHLTSEEFAVNSLDRMEYVKCYKTREINTDYIRG